MANLPIGENSRQIFKIHLVSAETGPDINMAYSISDFAFEKQIKKLKIICVQYLFAFELNLNAG